MSPKLKVCFRRLLFVLIPFVLSAVPLLGQGPVVRTELHHDVSPALRDIPPSLAEPAEKHDIEDLPPIPLPPGFKPADQPDAVLQPSSTLRRPTSPILGPTMGLNFEGLGDGFPNFVVEGAPPDTNGAVGKDQYVQWVNVSFAVFDKATGNLILGPLAGNSLWTGFGDDCETNNDGDPIVTYDKIADRWVFAQFAVRTPGGGGFGPFLQCVAVSTTSDATGTYNRYSFSYDNFNDYPKVGVWPDAYYATFNIFDGTTLLFIGADACAFDRNAMLNGQTATQVCFPQDTSVLGLLPADLDGHTLPPTGSPNPVTAFAVNSLNIFPFHVDFTTPANSTFGPAVNVPVSPFTPLCPKTFHCVPQPPGDGTQLDSLGDRLMYRLAYRNFGDHESLVVNHSVVADPVNGNSGVRWYEIQSPNNAPVVVQQSTFAPDGSYRWMGSVAMDVSGDLAAGYSVSSSTVFPSIAIAARAFNDPVSTLQPEINIMSGTGSQTSPPGFSLTRWGDYSAMQVDPADDCTFWYTNEYIAADGSFNWHTRIANFKFPGCGVPDLAIAKTHTGNFTQGQPGTYTITVTNNGGKPTDGSQVTVSDNLPTGLSTPAASGTGWTCTVASGNVSCTRSDALDSGASYPAIKLTVNVDANAPGSLTNTATVAGGGDNNASNNSASDVTTIIQTGADLAITKSHTGSFIQGQTGTYTITVSNVGLSATDGTKPATVTDTLPAGLTGNAAAGTGWSCVLGPPVGCTRSDSLGAGSSYPAITLTVNVANNAQATVTNSATVAGGGDVNSLNNTANDPTSVIPPPPDLTITKTHSGNFNQGQNQATYAIVVSNVGSGPTTGAKVQVTDTLPTGLTLLGAGGIGWACLLNFGTNTATCSRNDVLAVNGKYPQITTFANVASNAPASVTNTATVSGGGEVNTGNDSASDPTTINPSPDLTIAKTHNPDPLVVGQTGTYTLTVSNVGNAGTSGNVQITDFLPNGLVAAAVSGAGWNCSNFFPTSFLSCSRSDVLAAGGSFPALVVTVNINAGQATVTNTAFVSGGGEFNTTNDSASDTASVSAPSLTISKSHNGDFTVGLPGTYTITVGNNGKVATAGTVQVTDTLPGGMTATSFTGTGWSCNSLPTQFLQCSRSDSLPNGSSYPPLSVTVNVASATATVVNTASVSGGGDVNLHSANDSTNVNTPTLNITKSHSGNFVVGEDGIFQINVSNTGKVATVGTVTVSDFLPFGLTAVAAGGPGWSCSQLPTQFLNCSRSDSLAPGAAYQPLVVTANVSNALSIIVNTAQVSGGGDGRNNNVASDTVNVTTPVLAITKTHSGTFTAGGSGTYTITVSNKGPIPTTGNTQAPVTVQDFLPFGLQATAISATGWSCSQIPTFFITCQRSDVLNAGSSYPAITLTVSINNTGQITNSANVTGGGDGTNHSASDTVTVNQGAVLAITKTHTGDFTVGTPGSYTITVSNNGKLATGGTVTVQDFFPFGMSATAVSGTGWTCNTLPTSFLQCTRSDALNTGSSYPPLVVTVSVNSGSGASTVTNTASVTGGGDPLQHSANDPTNINAPSLSITKTHTPDPFVVGQTGTYTITVDNKAGKAATTGTVTVQDFLPQALSATQITGMGWSCSTPPTNFVTCTRSDALSVGAIYPPITLKVAVNGGGPTIANNASVNGGGDSQFHNASDTANVTAPVLAITKTHTPDPFVPGQPATYTITVSNTGSIATSGTVTVSDTMPVGLTVATASGTGWGCNNNLASVTCTRSDSLAGGGSSYPALTLSVNVNNPQPTVVNQASVTGGGDTNLHVATDTANATTPVLAITKTHTGNFTVGQPGTYTITVSNVGTIATVATVTVSDFLPFGFTATAISGTGWGCGTLPTSFLTCTRSDSLASNSSYPPLVVTVSISSSSSSVTNTASVTGGGDGLNHNASDLATVTTPTLSISKTHSGVFTAGQSGTYTITVSNPGTIASSGFVSLQDSLPSGLAATAITGSGWGCSSFFPTQFVSCSRSDSLAAGSSYPAITMTVSIDPSTQNPVVNTVSMSGGGDANSHLATDSTTVSYPDLAIAMSHTGNFFVGQNGAAYTITVSNAGSMATTGGTLTVADVLPAGLTATGASGTGWTCTIFNGPQTEMDCTRPAGGLSPNNSFPAITLMTNVGVGAPASVINSASLFGINENNLANNTSSDTATVAPLAMSSTSASTVTVAAGSPGTFTFQVNVGTNPSVAPVSFALTGLPPNSTVTFNPTSLTQSGTVTMTISTSGNGHVASAAHTGWDQGVLGYAALLLPVFSFVALGLRDRKRRRWLWMGASVCVLIVMLSLPGCGGGGTSGGPTPTPTPTPTPAPTTPSGTYAMTVTANGSGASSSTPVTLIVQ